MTMITYLIKYSPEIGTKRKGTKEKFTRQLKDNIINGMKRGLKKENFQQIKVRVTSNHIILYSPEVVDETLSRIAGIKYFAKVKAFAIEGMGTILEEGRRFFQDEVEKAGTYAVRCKKTNNHQLRQAEVERELGAQLQPFGTVNLENPGIICYVEIRGDQVYLYHQKIPGMSGAPIGVQGKALTMFSGGIDSPVASWMVYRTGLDQDFLFFDLGAEEQQKKARKAYSILKWQWGSGSRGSFIELNFVPCIEEILKAPESYQTLILKYFFYKAADKVARLHNAKAMVTGESIGQVSTQTLKNLAVLDQISDLMIIRPLSTFTKGLITDYATKIGTFSESYKGPEFCALAGKNVVTDTYYEALMDVIGKVNTSVIDSAVENRKIFDLDEAGYLLSESKPHSNEPSEMETSKVAEEAYINLENADEVIDLRKDGENGDSLPGKTRSIPFEQAWQDYLQWDPEKTYLLVCEVGSQSKILAHHMHQEGFKVNHLEGGVRRYLEGIEQ